MPLPSLDAAWKFWLADDLAGADRECRTLLQQAPETADAWRLRSRIALKLGHREAVAGILESGFRASRKRELLQELVAFHIRDRNPEQARRWLHESNQTEERGAVFEFQMALCDWLEGEHESAIHRFQTACVKDPGNREYPVRMAQALASLGNAREAARWLHAMPRDSLGAGGYGLLVLCEFDLAGAKAALLMTQEAVALHASDSRLRYLHAVLLTLCGHEKEITPLDMKIVMGEERARWESFDYAHKAGSGAQWHGLDTAVLAHGIEAAPSAGLVLEFGVYQALSLRFIAERVAGAIHGFDSFRGLPEAWEQNEGAGSYDAHGRLPRVPAGVSLHAGWFEDTLPRFIAEARAPIRLMHIDCDLYSSTATVLHHTRPLLRPGTVVVFDEYLGYPGYENHEFLAWHEFVKRYKIGYKYLAFNLMAKKAALKILGVNPPGSGVL